MPKGTSTAYIFALRNLGQIFSKIILLTASSHNLFLVRGLDLDQ